jgi:hypothetical protein
MKAQDFLDETQGLLADLTNAGLLIQAKNRAWEQWLKALNNGSVTVSDKELDAMNGSIVSFINRTEYFPTQSPAELIGQLDEMIKEAPSISGRQAARMLLPSEEAERYVPLINKKTDKQERDPHTDKPQIVRYAELVGLHLVVATGLVHVIGCLTIPTCVTLQLHRQNLALEKQALEILKKRNNTNPPSSTIEGL